MAKLTREQIDRIVELRERGFYSHRIAQMTGIKPATVNYQLLKNGFDPWDPAKRQAPDGHVSRFSEAEDAQMLELGRQGMSIRQIARTMKRPITSIRIRILTLEVRAENALEKAA
jgi:hypothetical protein